MTGKRFAYNLLLCLLSFLPLQALSIEIDTNSYDIYYGDLDEDGDNNDIYFHGKSSIVLIASDIIIPIVIHAPPSYALHEDAGSYSVVLVDPTLDDVELSFLTPAQENADYFITDFDNDSRNDILIRGATSGDTALVIHGSGDQSTPEISVEYTGDTELAHNLSNRSTNISLVDMNGDGLVDIRIPVTTEYGADIVYLNGNSTGYPLTFSYDNNTQTYPTTLVGSTAAEFRVNESGAATYSLPLTLPDGVAGVTPTVSLNYASMGGNSLMGLGWSLAAGSQITRCRQTLYKDGQAMPIQLDAEDRFCLEGQRLVMIEGSTYGDPGSKYKTEIDNYDYIEAVGGSYGAGNPSYFKVISKDGTLKRYGYSADSKRSLGNATLTWAMSDSVDNTGLSSNRIYYDYAGDADNFRLASIRYADGAAEVEFNYDDRPDPQSSYLAGYKLSTTLRLNQVTVTDTNQLLRHYYVQYLGTTPSNNFSRVGSIQECAADASQCLPPLTFEWAVQDHSIDNVSDFSLELTPSGTVNICEPSGTGRYCETQPYVNKYLSDYKPADINGDGCSDIVYGYFDNAESEFFVEYSLANASCDGFEAAEFMGSVDSLKFDFSQQSDRVNLNILDYNADGRSDLAVRTSEDGEWNIYMSIPNTDGTWQLHSVATASVDNADFFIDVNADGLLDALYTEGSGNDMQIRVRRLVRKSTEPDGSSSAYYFFPVASYINGDLYTPTAPACSGDQTSVSYDHTLMSGNFVGDFDGDGQVEFVMRSTMSRGCRAGSTGIPNSPTATALAIYSIRNNTLTRLRTITNVDEDTQAVIADFNGDGLSDIIYGKGSDTWLRINNGTAFESGVIIPGISIDAENTPNLVDQNADGYPDLVWHNQSANQLQVFHWNRESETFGNAENIASAASDNDAYLYLDANGNGVPDRVRISNARSTLATTIKRLYVYEDASDGVHNVITSVDNNFGNVNEISYKRLNETGDHYMRLQVGYSDREEYRCWMVREQDAEPGTFYYRRECGYFTVNDASDFYSAINNPFALESGDAEFGKPVFDINSSMHVVTNVTSSAPTASNPNATAGINYTYYEGKAQAGGRGFLGFRTLETTDLQTGIVTRTNYNQKFPLTGMPSDTIVLTPEGEVLKESVNSYYQFQPSGVDYYQPQLQESIEAVFRSTTNDSENDGLSVDDSTPLHVTKTSTYYDIWGNVTTSIVFVDGEFEQDDGSTITLSQYEGVANGYYGDEDDIITLHDVDFSHRALGRLTSSTTFGQRDGDPMDYRYIDFTYHDNGLLHEEIIEPNSTNNSEKLTTAHSYDDFGNREKSEVTGWNGYAMETRTTEMIYDADGRYLVEKRNDYGHVLSKVIDRNKYGVPTVVESLNGLSTTTDYDSLGREISRSDNSATENTLTTEYLFCSQISPGCPSGGQYATRTSQQHGTTKIQYFDRLGRVVRKAELDFGGSWIYVDQQYDILGRVVRVSEPYYTSPQYWTETSYDILGRARIISTPDTGGVLATSAITYDGLATTSTNPAGHTKRETKNNFGELVKVEDNVHDGSGNNHAYIRYSYDVEGRMTRATVHSAEGDIIETEIFYDRLGRKTEMRDPDKGTLTYEYNAFGELIRQQDANGQVVRNRFDTLGRLVARTDYENAGETVVENHTRWYFDGATDESAITIDNALGNVSAIIMSRNTAHEACYSDSTRYCSYPEYDSIGRPTINTTHIDDDAFDATAKDIFANEITYDPVTGRVDTTYDALDGKVTDSAGNFITSGTRNHYNNYGFLERTEDLHSGDTLYRTVATNARGQVTEAEVGPYGRTLYYDDATGRLERQIAYVGGLTSVSETPDAFTIQHVTYTWDVLGNLVSRHNQSAHRNDGNSAGNNNIQESFCYDDLNRLIKTNIGTTSTSGCGSLSLAEHDVIYDSIGNITYKHDVGDYNYDHATKVHAVTSTSDGNAYLYDNNGNMTSDDERTIVYSTFDKPLSITKGSHTSHFYYGPDRARYLQFDANTSNSSKTSFTVYVGNLERIEKANGTQEWRRAVPGGVRTIKTNHSGQMSADQPAEKRYIFNDHLGSIDIIADAIGNVEQSMSFDPWGARRQESTTLTLLTATELFNFDNSITSRGYTSHEMLDEVGLIHMNGRIYDPRLARFLQADPFIQAATDIQMYNRYSYLRNNPLNATDPSGYFLDKVWKKIRPFVGAIVGIVLAVYCPPCTASFWGAVGAGAAAGAAGAAANGGTLRDVLKGAVIGGISAAAFYGVGEAFANCTTCQAGSNAGTFGTELTASAFAKKVLSHALVGGVMSVLQGGKFGHGFASAGVTQAFSGKIDGLDKFNKVSAQRAIAAAIVGGTASVISGGKFANGAITAAFSRMFNDEAHYEVEQEGWQFGDPLPQGLVDAVTGFGDGAYSAVTFGMGDLGDIRALLGIDGGVDQSSSLYSGGHLAGAINGGAALGGAIGLLGKGIRGFEYSHFVPQRFLNRFGITRAWKSPLNGTYVPKLFHALTDKFRYRFMPRTFKAQFGSSSFIPQGAQQTLRVPPVYVGGALGATTDP